MPTMCVILYGFTYLQSMFTIITVNGVFRETSDTISSQDHILGFSRTFVLKKFASGLVCQTLRIYKSIRIFSHHFVLCSMCLLQGLFRNSAEYRIINEIALFYRPSAMQLDQAFKSLPVLKTNVPEPLSADDQRCLLIVFNDLTGLDPAWSRK